MFLRQWWEESVFEKHRAPRHLTDGPPPQEARPPGIPPPGRARYTIANDPAPGHRTRGEADQEHRTTRRTARNTLSKLSKTRPAVQLTSSGATSRTAQHRPRIPSCRHRLLQPVSGTTGSGRGHTGTGLEVHPGHRRAPGAAT